MLKTIWLFLIITGIALAQPSFMTGFEMGTLSEGFGSLNTGSVQSAVVRSGQFAYRANPVSSNQTIVFASRSAGGALRPLFRSSRFYLQVGALPVGGSVSIVKIGGATTFNPEVDLNPNGTLTVADSLYPSIATSSSALTADGLWHRIEVVVGIGQTVYVDGTLWVSGGQSYSHAVAISFGAGQSPTSINVTCDLYFDDILVDAGNFPSGLPGDSSLVLLGSISTVGDIFTMPPYSSAIPAGATVLETMPVCVDSTTRKNPPTGSIGSTFDPAGSAYNFNFGDGMSIASTDFGPVSQAAVNQNQAPQVTVSGLSSRSTVSFVGLYAAYR